MRRLERVSCGVIYVGVWERFVCGAEMAHSGREHLEFVGVQEGTGAVGYDVGVYIGVWERFICGAHLEFVGVQEGAGAVWPKQHPCAPVVEWYV